jgi:hypothetical protein
VIWIVITPKLVLKSYRWFGSPPGEPLPDIREMKVAKHTKGNAEGTKLERPNQRLVPRGRFEQIETLDSVLARLFGSLP